MEHALDLNYAPTCGVDVSRLIVAQSQCAEEALEVAEFDIMYDQGISREGEVLDLGVGCDVITKRESFYSHGSFAPHESCSLARLVLGCLVT